MQLLLADATSLSLWSMIQQGGWAMYPLAACSLVLIFIVIHCLRETRPAQFGDDPFAERIAELCRSRSFDAARQAALATPSRLAKALANAFRKIDHAAPAATVDSFENEIFDTLEIEENDVSQWIHYLSVTANVAPMIGLLGTVSGMIGGFQTMATGGMGRPELFAGDIGEALITTATGLCIGIPAMIAHSYFSNRLNTLMVETTRRANAISDTLRPHSIPANPANVM